MTLIGQSKQNKKKKLENFYKMYPKLLTQGNNGLIVQMLLDTLEIKPIVDLAGLSEQLKPIMIDYVLKLVEIIRLCYQLLILLDVVDSQIVSHSDVTEVKLELHGYGSKELVLSVEQVSVIKILVILILCLSVLIMLKEHNTLIAHLSNKLNLLVIKNAKILLTIEVINKELKALMVFLMLTPLKEIWFNMDQLLQHLQFMKIL